MASLLVIPMVSDVSVFDDAVCTGIAERIERMRPQWLNRGPGFSTIGVAAYLDVMCSTRPEETYYGRLAASNQFIRGQFSDVLEAVRQALMCALEANARFESSVALPGFHIFEDAGLVTEERPSQHFDLQHRSLRWPFGPVSDEVISFTLALKLPRLGGGLDVWDITEDDLARLHRMGREVSMEQLGRLKPRRVHAYKPGVMAVQRRPIMHRIAAVPQRFASDQRMTLQGHGVRDGDCWVLYW
jgi:hypothetical protein